MDQEKQRELKIKLSSIAYYLIIGLVSVLVTAFIPMLGSDLDLAFNFPNTKAGWIVWSISKISIAIINMLLFHLFQQQAKINVKDEPHYKEACEILQQTKIKKEILPLSPKQYNLKQYLGKGSTLFLTSLLSTIGFTQAILTFDVLTFIALTFTVVMGLVFGFLSMKKAELYWTVDFYEYALITKKRLERDSKPVETKIENSGVNTKEKEND